MPWSIPRPSRIAPRSPVRILRDGNVGRKCESEHAGKQRCHNEDNRTHATEMKAYVPDHQKQRHNRGELKVLDDQGLSVDALGEGTGEVKS